MKITTITFLIVLSAAVITAAAQMASIFHLDGFTIVLTGLMIIAYLQTRE